LLEQVFAYLAVDIGRESGSVRIARLSASSFQEPGFPVIKLVKQLGHGCVSFAPIAQPLGSAIGQTVVDQLGNGVKSRRPVRMTTPKDRILDALLRVGLGVLEPFDEKVGIVCWLVLGSQVQLGSRRNPQNVT
jgi:hypothetical protein